jgi:SPP1 gp7 family putative phage head morphogenesis protein
VTTAAQLVARRLVVARSRARRPARRVVPATPPRGAIVAYTATLTDLGRAMDAVVLAALRRADVVRRDAPPPDGDAPIQPARITRILRVVERRLRTLAGSPALALALEAVAARVDAWAGAQLVRQLRALNGIDPEKFGADTRALRTAFRDQNLALIRTMGRNKVSRVRAILREHGPGGRVEQIQRDIEAETGATPARAALIARDQVLSLNAQVTQARHEAAGITEYVWSTSRDERVRASHRALEGRTFAYADPPVVDAKSGRRENPGQDFRCRCVAVPVVPRDDVA